MRGPRTVCTQWDSLHKKLALPFDSGLDKNALGYEQYPIPEMHPCCKWHIDICLQFLLFSDGLNMKPWWEFGFYYAGTMPHFPCVLNHSAMVFSRQNVLDSSPVILQGEWYSFIKLFIIYSGTRECFRFNMNSSLKSVKKKCQAHFEM